MAMASVESVVTSEMLAAFVAGCDRISREYSLEHFDLEPPTMVLEMGRRYARVVRVSGASVSAHAFVDLANGDVLKPASYKTPAKHARGNLFDPDGGLKWMGPYGPAYLR